jgi:predicted ABC-class ATPase
MGEGEFRIGDVASAGAARKGGGPTARKGLDTQAFPILAEWMRLPANAFRERVDALTARARSESSQAAQRAILLAVQILNALYKNYGGAS